MQVELLTKSDLEQFKIDMLHELRSLLQPKTEITKQFLKTKEVCEMLNISESKLQTLRINGEITYSMIGKNYYYNIHEVTKQLTSAPEKPTDFFSRKAKN